MGVMQQQRASMNMLLTLQPYRLEQSFWKSTQARRGLMIADVAACVTALVHASIMVYRVAAAEPGKSTLSIYFGPQHPLFSLGMQKIMYQAGALLLLMAIGVAAAGGRDYYAQHRHTLCLMNRLLRLVVSSTQLMSAGARTYLAPALLSRMEGLQHRPMKALMIMTLHPVIFWMMQAHFVLPWRWAILMQLVNTAVALSFWSRQLPCFLQAFQLQHNSSPELFYQQHAVELCQNMQYIGSALRMALGDVTYVLHDDRVCEGLRAVQVLQAFVTIVGLLVLPLSIKYGIEGRFKRQFLRLLDQADGQAAAAEAAAAVSTAGSSSSSRGETQAEMISRASVAMGGSGSSGSAAVTEDLGDLQDLHWANVLRWMTCLTALLVASWLLAELLVVDLFSRATCAADG